MLQRKSYQALQSMGPRAHPFIIPSLAPLQTETLSFRFTFLLHIGKAYSHDPTIARIIVFQCAARTVPNREAGKANLLRCRFPRISHQTVWRCLLPQYSEFVVCPITATWTRLWVYWSALFRPNPIFLV